ncbi:flagellar type III secretion system protein FliQ [Escherichia coli]|nr:flagellar type III secretion system protein FliQ [Escherichia coli]
MTPESVMMMGTEAMKVALALAAPLLLVALVTGLIISILQAATQINEMTLSFIPKIIAVFIAAEFTIQVQQKKKYSSTRI